MNVVHSMGMYGTPPQRLVMPLGALHTSQRAFDVQPLLSPMHLGVFPQILCARKTSSIALSMYGPVALPKRAAEKTLVSASSEAGAKARSFHGYVDAGKPPSGGSGPEDSAMMLQRKEHHGKVRGTIC